jgi:putative ABC transport system substrate-binding protein
VLWNPTHHDDEFRNTERAAAPLGIEVVSVEIRGPDDFERAFGDVLRARTQALIAASSRLMTLNRMRIIEFAAQHRIILASGWGPWAQSGALLSYGPDLDVIVARLGSYVDKIVKGTRPAELPIEQPTRILLVINLKVAGALGLTIPPSLLLRADAVIR